MREVSNLTKEQLEHIRMLKSDGYSNGIILEAYHNGEYEVPDILVLRSIEIDALVHALYAKDTTPKKAKVYEELSEGDIVYIGADSGLGSRNATLGEVMRIHTGGEIISVTRADGHHVTRTRGSVRRATPLEEVDFRNLQAWEDVYDREPGEFRRGDLGIDWCGDPVFEVEELQEKYSNRLLKGVTLKPKHLSFEMGRYSEES